MLCFAYLLLVVCSWVGEGVNDVSSPHLRLIFLFSHVTILGYNDIVIVKHMFDNVLPTTLSKQKIQVLLSSFILVHPSKNCQVVQNNSLTTIHFMSQICQPRITSGFAILKVLFSRLAFAVCNSTASNYGFSKCSCILYRNSSIRVVSFIFQTTITILG